MKKSIILFSAIVGGAFLFQSCQNVEEEVKKATDAANAACTTQLDELNAQLTAANDQLTLLTVEKDSLLVVLDGLTAPKSTTTKKTTTKTTTKTETAKPADSREAMKESTTPGVDARKKMKDN